MTSLDLEMADNAARIERVLSGYLSGAGNGPFGGTPDRLLAAMRHGALGGGKRLRPYLLRVVAGMYGVPAETCVAAGAALEMVHSYSLVHDDLPDMDDDRLRRGQPSVWAAYDPATAILAGDALLSAAFEVLAAEATHADPAVRVRLVQSLARRSGAAGMVGGQARDLAAEGGTPTLDDVLGIQRMKTGDMIVAAMEMGGILGGETRLDPLTVCGHHAGLAFQIADDILDATGTSDTLGKTAGKDAAQGKATIVAVMGLDGARGMLAESVEAALGAIAKRGPEADRLRDVLRYFGSRER